MSILQRFCTVAFILCALNAHAGEAELSGTVQDPSGLPIAGVRIGLREESTFATHETTTSAEGQYRFLALPPGRYDVITAKDRFQTLRRTGIQLHVSDSLSLDLVLSVGNVSETVEVTGAAPFLQQTSGTVSAIVDQTKTESLPLDGRNFVPLIALSPGVMLPPGQLLPRINGSRPRVSEYLYDGISVLQPEPGQVAYYPVIDAIEEFRIQTNSYSAEYGRSNGGVIQVSTKTGTNNVHGTLFEFFRNEALNARNLFAPAGPKLPFKRNQYGLALGGALQRNKTFFFVDWQGTRLRTGITRFSTVPTSSQRQGVFTAPVFDPATTVRTDTGYQRLGFSGNTVPLTRWDPAARALLARYPSPNVYTGSGAEATANNYRRSGTDSTDADQFDTRLDRYFGARHRVFGRYSYLRDESRPTTPLPDGSGNITTSIIGNTNTRADSLVADDTWTLSSASVNQLRFGFTRRGFQRDALRTGEPASSSTGIPGIPNNAFADVLPTFDVSGYQQIGPPASGNANFTTSVTEFFDTYSTVRGRHSLKIGTDLRLERLAVLQPPNPTGNFQFTPVLTSNLTAAGTPVANTGSTLASFLLGQVQSFSFDAQTEVLQPRAAIAEFFVQDDWRITRRLSMNLGVRYTLNLPSTVAGDRGAVFNLNTQILDYLGKNGYSRSARELGSCNFGPRAGFAYQASDSLVIRSGYGLTWIEQAGITTPFTTPLFPFIQTITQRSLDNISPAFVLSQGPSIQIVAPGPNTGVGQGVFGVQRNNGSGYAQQWNLSIQKTLGADWSLEIGYLGSKLTRLGVPDTNLNQLHVEQFVAGSQLTQQVSNPYYGTIPASSSLGAPTIALQQLLRPFPRFTTVTLYRNNIGHSTYHSLQSRIERRFSRGLTLSAAYTFSKLIDDAGAVFDSAVLTGPVINYQAADSFNRRLEKDESTGSIPQVFSAGWVWDLPFARGWEIAGIVRAQSGMPLAVTQATNFNAAFGFGIQRPNRIGNPELPGGQRTLGRYFDTAAFSQANQFTIGSSSRNPVRGPGYQAVDLMVGKTFTMTERLRTEFRAEAFNVTNTPPLGQPNGSFGTGAFGTITSALDPRVFELAVKLHF